jgi:uncharacterized membrane protein
MEGTVEESVPAVDRISADLAGSTVLAVGIGALALVIDGGTAFTAIWLPFVAFVPGYTLVCAAFPSRARADAKRVFGDGTSRGITLAERLALSVATSVVLASLVGFALRTVGLSDRSSLVVSLCTLAVVGAVVATFRRETIPRTVRFEPDLTALSPVRAETIDLRTPGDLSAVIVVGLVVLLVVSGAAYAVAGPGEDTGDTAFYLLANDGESAAEDYPDTLTVDEESSLIVGIENDEGQAVTYTVVVQIQEVDDGSNVASATELDRFEATLEDGETLEAEHAVAPDRTGEDLRLTYLLYVGEPPESPGEDDAYRSTYVWVDVDEA